MKIIVLGGDGFCGWPTALHLSKLGDEIVVVDNMSRRHIDIELEVGSVNRVYPAERLWPETLAFATEVAGFDRASLRQAKRAVNATTDLMGQHHVATRLAEQLDRGR